MDNCLGVYISYHYIKKPQICKGIRIKLDGGTKKYVDM